jgi:WD repeat-containing protein 53
MITEIIPSQHTDSVLCCEIHPNRNLLISGDEDGCLCFTDLTTRSPLGRLRYGDGDDAIPSVSYNPTDEHSAFAAVGSSILRLDLRKSLGEEAILDTYSVNTDEINSIDVDPTGSWIAAGDDSGEIQLISLKNATTTAAATAATKPSSSAAYRTLRRGHTNICNAVTFRSTRNNELLSGGLDCRMVRWDYTKLRQLTVFDMNAGGDGFGSGDGDGDTGGQFFNPPMINSLAVCSETGVEFPSLVAVARGDGCVALYNGDAKAVANTNSTGGGGAGGGASGKGSTSSKTNKKANRKQSNGNTSANSTQGTTSNQDTTSTALCWAAGTHQGGHTAAVNCVSFLKNTAGKRLLSVGNDRKVLIWDWQNTVEPVDQLLHRSKINWVCSGSGRGSGGSGGGGGGGGMNAVMADVAGKLIAVSFKE